MTTATQLEWAGGVGSEAAARPEAVAGEQATSFPLSAPTAALVVLNLLDAVFTLGFLQLGLAEELNPLMRWAYEADPLVFMVSKLLCVNAGVLVLALHQQLTAARWVMRGAASVYTVLVLYHLGFLAHSLLR